MRELVVQNSKSNTIFSQLHSFLKGKLTEVWTEREFSFNNELGSGKLRTIPYSWGISLLDFDLTLKQELKIVFDTQNIAPIEFIFISQGYLNLSYNSSENYSLLEQFQNIILSPKIGSRHTLLFPKEKSLKLNFIQLIPEEYKKKPNNNLSFLNESLLPLFNVVKEATAYQHLGSLNLKIADEVKQLNQVPSNGILRTLSIEGRLYLILSMQLLEHQNFIEKMNIPEAISKEEIKKIHELTVYILEHISEYITINILSAESGLSPKKLQLGFKILYSKTVNEYVRQLKLEISRDYLKNSNLSVSEIVYAIGIKSRSYFSKIFFETYDILPTEYRKHLKNN